MQNQILLSLCYICREENKAPKPILGTTVFVFFFGAVMFQLPRVTSATKLPVPVINQNPYCPDDDAVLIIKLSKCFQKFLKKFFLFYLTEFSM